MYILRRLLFVLPFFLIQTICSDPFILSKSVYNERIVQFKSHVTIVSDGSLHVVENITVRTAGNVIRHGIVREFPTHYKDNWGNNYSVQFQLNEVLLDGKDVPYHVEKQYNGVFIYIGQEDVFLKPGTYTYTITYTTQKQLGFFKTYDELYWNVTGNGWRLPIDTAVVSIELPHGVLPSDVGHEAYTGYTGDQAKEYRSYIKDNTVIFETTKPLRPYQGLTIVTTWPKGYVTQPGFVQKWKWFFLDNILWVYCICGLIVVLAYYNFAYIKTRKPAGTIIPRFYPPRNFSPGFIRYIDKKGYDNTVFTAEIVHMAVHGFLTIHSKKQFFKTVYSLHKHDTPKSFDAKQQKERVLYEKVMQCLFDKNNTTIDIAQSGAKKLQAALRVIKYEVEINAERFVDHNIFYQAIGIGISAVFGLSILFFNVAISSLWFLPLIVLVVLNIGFLWNLTGYSYEGRALQDEIEGFKLFLTTTEKDRIEMIGTPPTKTPELYETYLAYAIALGVEQKWAAQFTPLFEKLAQQGKPYTPHFYRGPGFSYYYTPQIFASDVSRSMKALNSSISSATRAPGTFSGSGGRGSSGGGGGGGGGGGW